MHQGVSGFKTFSSDAIAFRLHHAGLFHSTRLPGGFAAIAQKKRPCDNEYHLETEHLFPIRKPSVAWNANNP